MDIDTEGFRIWPKLVKVNSFTSFTVESTKENQQIIDNQTYEIVVISVYNGYPSSKPQDTKIICCAKENKLFFKYVLTKEQEYKVYIRLIENDKPVQKALLSIYALEDDLFSLNPYKGDLHCHSNKSDGADNPENVVAIARRDGMDFIALTDHGKYYPSQEVKKFYNSQKIELEIVLGEEVHAPGNPVHIVNFGGKESVNEFFNNNPDAYNLEVNATIKKYNIPQSKWQFQIGSSLWIFEKIKSCGGLAVFCHPFWQWCDPDYTEQCNYISEEVIDEIIKYNVHDAYEIVGGFSQYEWNSNQLQISCYMDYLKKGIFKPILGVTDCHDAEHALMGWYYTIVFSETNKTEDVIKNIKDGRTVALMQYPGETPKLIGDHRYVKYAIFLVNEVFPLKDRLCYNQGIEMLNYVNNRDAISNNNLVERLYKKLKGENNG